MLGMRPPEWFKPNWHDKIQWNCGDTTQEQVDQLRYLVDCLMVELRLAKNPTLCDQCGRNPATMGVVIGGVSSAIHPWCDDCNRENIEISNEINEHEMRHFGGAWGLVGDYTYYPVEQSNCRCHEHIEDSDSEHSGIKE